MTVLRLIRHVEADLHREALCKWLAANDIDPMQVAARWISIELIDGQQVIRYRGFKVTADGRRLVDPDREDEAWTEERTAPLLAGLDLPAQGDRHGP